jgi:hypothetical protein
VLLVVLARRAFGGSIGDYVASRPAEMQGVTRSAIMRTRASIGRFRNRNREAGDGAE